MVGGCGNQCVKYMVFIFNFLFCVCGAALLGIALWVRFDNDFQKYLEEFVKKTSGASLQIQNLYIAIYVLCAIGALLFVTGFLGCCGAACESACLLGMFFVIVLILFIAELAAGIYLLAKKDEFKQDFNDWFSRDLIPKYWDDGHDQGVDANLNTEIRKTLDEIFKKFQCCGASGCKDFGDRIPLTCSSEFNNGCPQATGCTDKIYDDIKAHANIIAGIAIAILALELLGMIFAMILCCAIRQGQYAGY